MKKIKFLFGVHCHQPIGNFGWVIEEAYQKAYLPFMQVMERHPQIKFALHYSGVLYDYFVDKHPEFMDDLKKMVKRGQVEVMTAGYYEPILPIIPDADKVGQILLSNEFIQKNFGVTPRGLWLTERIWEPHLPKFLTPAGIEYVTVDDYHFISAGIFPEELKGYYLTEEEGEILKVFPISKTLRYLIPFRLPEETIKFLESLATEEEASAVILADDGEKFGVWPGTHKWVYEEGYLEKLLTLLEENSSWIETPTFSQYLDEFSPRGRVYLPTAAYFEMMEWALPTSSGKKLEKIFSELKERGALEDYQQFFKGGFFRNFFVKYPEANNLHKKMLEISQRLEAIRSSKSFFGGKEKDLRLKEAQIELYKGQCNCAYWHGIFGGLYLNYLRQALYEHLIKAEVLLDKYSRGREDYVDLKITDFDKDGQEEIILSNSLLNLYFAPHRGGALFELDYKPKAFNLMNTLSRREEVYHQKIKEQLFPPEQSEEATTIHQVVGAKEKGLEKVLLYDGYSRFSLLDHFLGEDTNLEKFRQAAYPELGNFVLGSYQARPEKKGSELTLSLWRQGKVKDLPVKVEKSISLLAKQSIVQVNYEITNFSGEKADFWFGVEFNFSLVSGKGNERYYFFPGRKLADKSLESSGEVEGVNNFSLVDEWLGLSVLLGLENPAKVWRFPIETVSQSEGGFEKTYQSSVVFPHWKFILEPNGKWKNKIQLRIEGR